MSDHSHASLGTAPHGTAAFAELTEPSGTPTDGAAAASDGDWPDEDWLTAELTNPDDNGRLDDAADVDPDDGADDAPDDDATGYDDGSSEALFDGDDGGLDLMQRRALVVLVKQRFLSEQKHAAEFQALVRDPRPIRSRLNDLFMDLVLDVERGVAFKRQVHPEGGGRFPTLLHDSPWGREETVVLVFLRSRYRHETAAGNGRAFVDRDAIVEFVDQHRPAHATDRAGDLRRATSAIESLSSAGLLIGRKDGTRFEINRAIEVLLPVEKLRLLLTWLQDVNHRPEPAKPADLDARTDTEADVSSTAHADDDPATDDGAEKVTDDGDTDQGNEELA